MTLAAAPSRQRGREPRDEHNLLKVDHETSIDKGSSGSLLLLISCVAFFFHEIKDQQQK